MSSAFAVNSKTARRASADQFPGKGLAGQEANSHMDHFLLQAHLLLAERNYRCNCGCAGAHVERRNLALMNGYRGLCGKSTTLARLVRKALASFARNRRVRARPLSNPARDCENVENAARYPG